MGPFWRVSVNRDDPQARLPPVEAILFLPRAPRMHAQCIRGHEKHHGRKCAARVRLVCWPCVGILSPVGFASIDRKKGSRRTRRSFLIFVRLATYDSIDGSYHLLLYMLIRRLLIKANTTVPRNNNSVNDHPFISRVAAFAYKHAKLNIHINFLLFAVHADEYAHRLGSNLHVNYYTSHYYRNPYRAGFSILLEKSLSILKHISIDSITQYSIKQYSYP